MRGVFRVGVCVSGVRVALVMALSARVETQSGLATTVAARATRRPDSTWTSNGFAEEFCAHQDDLVNSPNSPKIDDDECNFGLAADRVHRTRDGGRRRRSGVQRHRVR